MRDATEWGPLCPQFDDDWKLVGDEDCLQLNVWTPLGPAERRAVMFWIHGGGHVQGGAPLANAGLRVYDGRRLAEKTGNVVVTINYRLGPLGWLTHPGLTMESGAAGAGNYGTLDQIAALEWVRRNIEAFGGDPGRVMIFGESAGGVSVCSLIASRLAAGLFHSAVIQSGGCHAKPLKEAGEFGLELAVKAGCGGAEDPVACLRGLELERLMRARPVEIDVAGRPSEYGSVVDGFVLTDTPIGVIAAGEHNRVPVIVGSTSDETSRSVPLIRNEAEYVAAVRLLFPARAVAGEVLAMYPASDYASPRAAYVALTSDAKFICGARAAARALDENQAEPVWRYVMTHAPENTPPAFRALGAWHGLDMMYVFDALDALDGYRPGPGDRQVAGAFADYWGRLARLGYVNAAEAYHWNEYRRDDPFLEIAAPLNRGLGYRARQCDFWDVLLRLAP